jgi:hypothetical protein
MLQQSFFQAQNWNLVLFCQFQQLSCQTHASQPHEQYSRRHLRIFLVQKQLRILFKLRHFFLTTKPESLALYSQLKLFFTLDQPFLFQRHWTVFTAKSHWNWIAFLLLISKDSVDRVVVSFQVKWINKLSDFSENLNWSFVNGNLFTNFFT